MIKGNVWTRPMSLRELIEQLKTAREMRSMCAKGRESVYDDNINSLLTTRFYKEDYVLNLTDKDFEEHYKLHEKDSLQEKQ